VPAPRTPARPAPTAREIQAIREALALRQGTGRTLTAQETALLRAAASSRPAAAPRSTAPKRTAPKRTAPKGAAPRVGAKKPATRKPAARTTVRRKPTTPKPATPAATEAGPQQSGRRARWSRRIGVVAMSTVLLPALASVTLTGTAGPGGTGSSETNLALTAQTRLLEQADRYRELEQEAADARAHLQKAREAEATARAAVAAQQQVVGAGAAGLYTSTAERRYPMLALDAHDPAGTDDVLYLQALTERSDLALRSTVVRAERAEATLALASRRVVAAEAALDDVSRRAAVVLADAREAVDGLSTEVSLQLAALGTVPVSGPQQQRNDQALARWQNYLGRLEAAGIEAPTAAALADSEDLPIGFSPALDAADRPIPGIALAVDGNRPVTVPPAETIAAVSSALSQLGKPFAAGTTGPDTYDCGGFTSAAWLLAGYAVPATPQAQWATGAAVPLADLQIGDLVFSPGGQDVGIYLGNGEVIGASAGTYQVSVRSVAAGSSAVRVTLPAPAEKNAALTGVATTGPCGAALPKPGTATPRWGGWANGQIPSGALCELGVYSHALRCDAAASYRQMSQAYRAAFGHPLCITDSYRSLGAQVAAFYAKPTLAAVPGTSNHGWALAVDLCDGVNVSGTPQWTWMTQNAGRFGFVQPKWAAPGGDKPEPWHWEYGYIS
jgi:cell wall-associated NlpC family hydrolase